MVWILDPFIAGRSANNQFHQFGNLFDMDLVDVLGVQDVGVPCTSGSINLWIRTLSRPSMPLPKHSARASSLESLARSERVINTMLSKPKLVRGTPPPYRPIWLYWHPKFHRLLTPGDMARIALG
jgi:hypothetical protein